MLRAQRQRKAIWETLADSRLRTEDNMGCLDYGNDPSSSIKSRLLLG
jgi:hypothetical protein